MAYSPITDLSALPYGAVMLRLSDGKPLYANAMALDALGVTELNEMGNWLISCRNEQEQAPLFDAVATVEVSNQQRLRLTGSWLPLPHQPQREQMALFVLHLSPLVHPWRGMLIELSNTGSASIPEQPVVYDEQAESLPTLSPASEAEDRLLWERARFAALAAAVSQGAKVVMLWDIDSGVINYVSENLRDWDVLCTTPVYMSEWLDTVHPADLPELQLARAKLAVSMEADITLLSYRVYGENDTILTVGEHTRRVPAPGGIALACTVLDNRTMPHTLKHIDPLAHNRAFQYNP